MNRYRPSRVTCGLAILLTVSAGACSSVPEDEQAGEATSSPPPSQPPEPGLSPALTPAPSTDSTNPPRPGGVEPPPPPPRQAEAPESDGRLRDSVRLGPVLELPTVQDTAR